MVITTFSSIIEDLTLEEKKYLVDLINLSCLTKIKVNLGTLPFVPIGTIYPNLNVSGLCDCEHCLFNRKNARTVKQKIDKSSFKTSKKSGMLQCKFCDWTVSKTTLNVFAKLRNHIEAEHSHEFDSLLDAELLEDDDV